MKRILKWVFGILAVLLVVLFALPFLFKGKIVELIKAEANKNLNATLAFDNDISLSLFRSFPDFSVGINNLSLANKGDFEGDTLISAKEFRATLDLMSVINGDAIHLKKIYLNQPRIQAKVLKDGRANWDITLPDTAKKEPADTASKFKASLHELKIDNGYLVYDDAMYSFYTKAENMNHTLSGDFTADLFELKTLTDIDALTLGYGGVNYLTKVKTHADATLDMDMKQFKFTFKKNTFVLNALETALDGWLAMPTNDMDMDLKLSCKQTDFKNILSLIPGIYNKDFEKIKTSGKMGLAAAFKGIYNEKRLPAFDIKLDVAQGAFAYPGMPTDVRNVNLHLAVNNPDGVTDHTLINLQSLHAEIGKNPVDAKLTVKTPVSDADIDAVVKGRINLSDLTRIMPQEKGTELSGTVVSNLEARGRISAITNKQYENFHAAGTLGAEALHYRSASFTQGIDISSMNLDFTPKQVNLTRFDSKIGNSDMQATGSLDNFMAYVFKGETLKGNLNLTSTYFDVNQFLAPTSTQAAAKDGNIAPQPQDTVPLTAIALPTNVNFAMSSQFGALLYDNLLLKNMKGQLSLANGKLNMNGLTANLFNGTITLDGMYEAVNLNKPSMDIKLKLQSMDIAQASRYFTSLKKWAPISEYISGNFSTELRTDKPMTLSNALKPDLASLFCFGSFELPAFKLSGFKPVDAIADATEQQQYKQVAVQKLKGLFEIKNGRLYITRPIDFKLNQTASSFSGSQGLDQSLDYVLKLNIPRTDLGKADAAIQDLLNKAAAAGVKLKLPDTYPVNVKVLGKVQKPEVKTDLNEVKQLLIADIKKQLLGLVDQKKQELTDKAKAEAEKAKQQALNEADRLKKEAEQKAQAEKDRLKKQAEEEAAKAKQKAAEEAKKKLKGLWK